MSRLTCAMLATALLVAPTNAALAEDADNSNTEDNKKSEIEKFSEFLQALNELQDGKDNQITAAESTGQFEIDVLGAVAIGELVEKLATSEALPQSNAKILILGKETYSFGLTPPIVRQANVLGKRTEELAGPLSLDVFAKPSEIGATTTTASVPPQLIGAIGQIATLLRNETKLKEFSISGIDEKMLVHALAAKLNRDSTKNIEAHVLAGSPGIRLDFEDPTKPNWNTTDDLARKIAWLLAFRIAIVSKGESNDEEVEKKRKAWIKEFDEFLKQLTASQGEAPTLLSQAITADSIDGGLDGVLQLNLITKGGTRSERQNFGTVILGLDPFRVSGGLTATYTYFDAPPNQRSKPVRWGVVSCSTDELKLDNVRNIEFGNKGRAVCRIVSQYPPPS